MSGLYPGPANQGHARSSQDDNESDTPAACGVQEEAKSASNSEALSLLSTAGEHQNDVASEPHLTMLSTLAWWIPELSLALLSVANLMVLVLVLHHYSDRALSDLGLPSHLTLNGLVAILSTLNRGFVMGPIASVMMQELWLHYAERKASLGQRARLQDMALFDDASRGIWGSLVFLSGAAASLARGRRSKLIGCIASLVTVFSLGFGTFAQQLISYNELKATGASRAGAVPRAEVWESFIPSQDDDGAQALVPRQVVAALYTGILTGGIQPLSAACPSGNCTWPEVPSLAVCGGCSPSEFELRESYSVLNAGYDLPFLNYSLPSGKIATLYDFDKDPVGQCGRCNMGYAFRAMNDTGKRFADPRTPYIAQFSLIGVPEGFNDLSNFQASVSASECALWFCVPVYKTTVTASENEVHEVEVSNLMDGHQPGEVSITTTMTTTWTEAASTEAYTFTATFDPWAVPTRRVMVPPRATGAAGNSTFNISRDAFDAMTSYLAPALEGAVTLTQSTTQFSNDLIYGIWNGTKDLDTWIENVARSLTNVVRTTGVSRSNSAYDGTLYELGVTIRWDWIVLPVLLVCVSNALLIWAIVKTHFSPVRPWKGSPLTLLLFDVDDDIRKASYGHEMQRGGLEKAVGKKSVRLEREPGKNWKFKSG